MLVERKAAAGDAFGAPYYCLPEQLGFRKILDTTFMPGALVTNDAEPEDIAKHSHALRRVHTASNWNAARIISRANCRRSTAARSTRPGERLVFEPDAREAFDRTRKRIDELIDDDRKGRFGYIDAGESAAA